MSKINKIAALITTDKRGVFMGYINPEDTEKTTLTAEDIRMCVYWSAEVKGVLGLASTGPNADCRVSKATPKGVLHGVTAVVEITKGAEDNWKKEPWS